MRAQTEYVPNNHGLARMAYIDRFGESNPEFFSLLPSGRRDNDPGLQHPGALCYSNPGFREVLFRDAQAFLSGFSAEYRDVRHARYGDRAMWSAAGFQPGYFNAMPQDGLGANRWCRCPDCWPYWTENRSGELVWGYTVDLAERLKQAGIPGFVTQMAYTPFRNPPPFPIPDNIRVQLAVSGPWNENISDIATATRIEADRYTVEVSIPLADLTDFLPKPDTTWVANFARSRNLRGQSASDNHVSWSPFLRRGFHEPDRFGRIRFVTEDAPADDNLLRNGDFSVLSAPGRPDGWSLSTPGDPPIGTVQVTNDDYRSGGQSLRIEMEHPGRLMAAQTLPDLVPGQSYLLTAFVRGNDLQRHPEYAGRHCGAYLNIWAGRNFFFPQNWMRGSFGWSKMAFTFTAPEEPIARPPYLRLALMNTTGSVHFDDVRLRTMP